MQWVYVWVVYAVFADHRLDKTKQNTTPTDNKQQRKTKPTITTNKNKCIAGKKYTHKHQCNPCGCGCFDHDENDLIGFLFIGFNSNNNRTLAFSMHPSYTAHWSIQMKQLEYKKIWKTQNPKKRKTNTWNRNPQHNQ